MRLAGGPAPAFLAALAWAGAAAAQPAEIPQVISPLQVQSDHNAVNLASGKTTIDGPVLSVPAAPNLLFDRVQNAAPYVVGRVQGQAGGIPSGNWTVHLGNGRSESFQCSDSLDCDSITGSGSTLRPSLTLQGAHAVYRQAGTGAVWHFDRTSVATGETRQSYASSVSYPNGERIGITYQTVVSGPFNQVFHRPQRVASNLGYHIDLTYHGQDFAADPTSWSTVATATIYRSSESNTPLRRLSYGGGAVVDSGTTVSDTSDDRAYICSSCGGTLGADVEAASGMLQLPGDPAPTLVVAPQPTRPLVQTVTRDGVVWTYAYLNPHQEPGQSGWFYDRVTVTGPDGFNLAYNMAKGGPARARHLMIASVSDSLQRQTLYQYDSADRPTRITHPEGNAVSVQYDEMGNIVSRTMHAAPGSGTLPADIIATAGYPDPPQGMPRMCTELCWRPNWSRDALGRQTDYRYNTDGQLTERTEPAVDGVRRRTIITYTPSPVAGISRPTKVTVCGVGTTCGTNQEIRTDYEYLGDTLLVTLERRTDLATGATLDTRHAYDAAGRRIATDGPMPGPDDSSFNRYDVHGRLTGTISADPDGAGPLPRLAVRNGYDPADRLTKVETGTLAAWQSESVAPADWGAAFTVRSTQEIAYDAAGRKLRESLREGAAGAVRTLTQYSYDPLGRLECTAVRMNPAAFGSLPASACDQSGDDPALPRDRIARTVYDAAGQRLQLREGVGVPGEEAAEATWAYNLNGQVTQVIDGNGNRAELRYDGHGRQDRWTFPSAVRPPAYDDSTPASALASAGAVNPADYEAYTYDAAGNRVSRRLRSGETISYSYDALGRMERKDLPGTAADVWYGYDLQDRMIAAAFTRSWTGVTFGYDAFGRMTWTRTNLAGFDRTLYYAHDPAGNRIRLYYPDEDGDPVATDYLIQERDALGRPTLLRHSDGSTVAQHIWDEAGRPYGLWRPGAALTYSHDALSRLTGLNLDLAGTAHDLTLGFSHNPAGQIATNTRSNIAYAYTGHYTVDRAYAADGLNRYERAGPPGQQITFAYDLRGNLTSDGANSYVYDLENRLISVSGAHNAALTYDPLGRLFEVASGGTVRRFLHDPGEGDTPAIVSEYSGSNVLLRRYHHGRGVDRPLAVQEGATRRNLIADERGSIIAIANLDGSLQAINRYDEYGVPQGALAGWFGYTGQLWLPEIGLYHYRSRLYSPTLGRFMQVDPIGYDDQFNLYAYVGNDPLNRTDPDGTCSTPSDSLICRQQDLAIRRAREAGQRAAWRQERAMVARGEPGTRDWSRAERRELLRHGRVNGYVAHHINTVNGNDLALARNPNNISFVTKAEHVEIHRAAGGCRQPICGQPLLSRTGGNIVRATGVLGSVSAVTGIISGRIRTDNLNNMISDMMGIPSAQDVREMYMRECGRPICA